MNKACCEKNTKNNISKNNINNNNRDNTNSLCEEISALVSETLVTAGSTFREDKKDAYRRAIAAEHNPKAKWVLETILEKLELYYDVKIVSTNERLLTRTYTGKFRQTDGVIEILRIMSRVYPFSIFEDESAHIIYIH